MKYSKGIKPMQWPKKYFRRWMNVVFPSFPSWYKNSVSHIDLVLYNKGKHFYYIFDQKNSFVMPLFLYLYSKDGPVKFSYTNGGAKVEIFS